MTASIAQTYPDPESYFTIGPYITDQKKFFISNTWEEDLTEPKRALIFAYLRANEKIDPVANKEALHGLVQNDIFEVVDGRHVFVIDLFKRWILKNLPV